MSIRETIRKQVLREDATHLGAYGWSIFNQSDDTRNYVHFSHPGTVLQVQKNGTKWIHRSLMSDRKIAWGTDHESLKQHLFNVHK